MGTLAWGNENCSFPWSGRQTGPHRLGVVRICVSANPVEFLSASPALTTAYAAASEIDSILKAVRSDVTDVFGKISC